MVGLRVNVANANDFARRLRQNKKLQSRFRRAVSKAQGVDEGSLGTPVVIVEGVNQLNAADTVGHPSVTHASKTSAEIDGNVRIEFHEPISKHLGPTGRYPVESSQAALENLGKAIQAEFPDEVRSANPMLESDLTTRCSINITMSSVVCQTMLSTALHVEQDMVQHLIMRELPRWVSNLTVGYEQGQIILQPTVKISTAEMRAAFGLEPAHRLRCTFETWVQSSMTKASTLFMKYSNGRCVGSAGTAHCYTPQDLGRFVADRRQCSSSDILPAHR